MAVFAALCSYLKSITIKLQDMIISISRSVSDHRVVNRSLYWLDDLLTIALLTYLCGGEDYQTVNLHISKKCTFVRFFEKNEERL